MKNTTKFFAGAAGGVLMAMSGLNVTMDTNTSILDLTSMDHTSADNFAAGNSGFPFRIEGSMAYAQNRVDGQDGGYAGGADSPTTPTVPSDSQNLPTRPDCDCNGTPTTPAGPKDDGKGPQDHANYDVCLVKMTQPNQMASGVLWQAEWHVEHRYPGNPGAANPHFWVGQHAEGAGKFTAAESRQAAAAAGLPLQVLLGLEISQQWSKGNAEFSITSTVKSHKDTTNIQELVTALKSMCNGVNVLLDRAGSTLVDVPANPNPGRPAPIRKRGFTPGLDGPSL